jgi:hypothetical protein
VRPRYLRVEGSELEVLTDPKGPVYTAVVPAPFITEEARAERVEAARREIVLDGYLITREKLVHNNAFDKRGEKTTTEFVFRPARDLDEARRVGEAAHLYLRMARDEIYGPPVIKPTPPRRKPPLAN